MENELQVDVKDQWCKAAKRNRRVGLLEWNEVDSCLHCPQASDQTWQSSVCLCYWLATAVPELSKFNCSSTGFLAPGHINPLPKGGQWIRGDLLQVLLALRCSQVQITFILQRTFSSWMEGGKCATIAAKHSNICTDKARQTWVTAGTRSRQKNCQPCS